MSTIKQILNNRQARALLVFTVVALSFTFYFHFSSGSVAKSYLFNRQFSNTDTVLATAESPSSTVLPEYAAIVPSGRDIVCLYQGLSGSGGHFNRFDVYDYRLNKKEVIDLKIPGNSNVLCYTAGRTIYTNSFLLYAYDHATGTNRRINIKGLRVFEITSLNDSATAFLCLAEYKNGDRFETGFYTVDIAKDSITGRSALIETAESTNTPQLMLKYAGSFVADKGRYKHAYFCNKYSMIWLFDQQGDSISSLRTLDKTPAPEVISDKRGMNFYKRGATWNTNTGLLFRGKDMLVFSTRSAFKDCMIVDVYDSDALSYKTSFKLRFENRSSSDIYRVYSEEERITIAFTNYRLASFVYSRYNE